MNYQLISREHLQTLARVIRMPEYETEQEVQKLDRRAIPMLEESIRSYIEVPTRIKEYWLQGFMGVKRP